MQIKHYIWAAAIGLNFFTNPASHSVKASPIFTQPSLKVIKAKINYYQRQQTKYNQQMKTAHGNAHQYQTAKLKYQQSHQQYLKYKKQLQNLNHPKNTIIIKLPK